jgi:hypothetical protein
MTKVQIRFRLPEGQTLDENLLSRISDAHALYGIQQIQVSPSLDRILVEYDATRLRPAEVEAALCGAGIPVTR